MNAKAIFSIIKVTIIGFMLVMTACSPLVVVPPVEVPPATSLPTIIASSPTLEPTAMPTVQPTVVPTNPPTATTVPVIVTTQCQDAAQYISDDGLDGTVYPPNTPFTKTWRLKNSGSCTWDSTYLVFQISGTFMTQSPGYMIVPQGQTVAPGQTVDISVGMTSPVENGNYTSYWGLKKRDGQFMPIQGGFGGNSFYVVVNVNGGAVAGKVTASSIDIEPEQGSGPACTSNSTYFVHAYITTDGPAAAYYEIGSTAGQIPAGNFLELNSNEPSPYVTGTLVFDQAGTRTINLRFVGPYPYPGNITIMLRVNGGEWHSTKLSCQG